MKEHERHAAGMTMRRAVLGDAHVDRAVAATTDATRDFQDLLTRYAWGEIWMRPGLDVKARRQIVIATLVALGRWDEFVMHVRAALAEGAAGALTRGEIREILLQQAVYCGLPAVNHAIGLVADLLNEPATPDPR